jgi:hypothetical protein
VRAETKKGHRWVAFAELDISDLFRDKLASDVFELIPQVLTKRRSAGNDGECDKGGDKAILDGSRAGFILDEACDNLRH